MYVPVTIGRSCAASMGYSHRNPIGEKFKKAILTSVAEFPIRIRNLVEGGCQTRIRRPGLTHWPQYFQWAYVEHKH